MNSIWDATYIVTDVETTGSNPAKDRITEIALVTVSKGEIVSEFSTLVNPHKEIPPYVARMTGISQQMVSRAPEEFMVIDDVADVFKVPNPVFVAHNVAFDYSFVNYFYKRGFRSFDYQQLCSLKLARKLLPRDIKKNVGDMSEYFGIRMKNRHRALIDAKATAMSLIEMLHLVEMEHRITSFSELMIFQNKPVYNYRVSADVTKRLTLNFDLIPYQAGIFRFVDNTGKVLYQDYCFNLNSKLRSFFGTHHITSKFVLDLTTKIDHIEYDAYESELSAMINYKNISESEASPSLFDNFEVNLNHHSESTAFVYLQAHDSGEKLIDFYFINSGKLVHQQTVGLKAPLDSLIRRLIEVFFNSSSCSVVDDRELKIIRKWIGMQNESGLMFNPTENDYAILSSQIKELMLKAYNINNESSGDSYYF